MGSIKECDKFLPRLKIEDLGKLRNHQNVDIFITQTLTLHRQSGKHEFSVDCPPIYVIIDECHIWIRGTKQTMSPRGEQILKEVSRRGPSWKI